MSETSSINSASTATAGSAEQTSEKEEDSRAGKYLTFVLGDEEYGLEILRVREIMGAVPITSIPQAPHHVRGVINLRGSVIPIIDLRLNFGMEARDYDKETCFIVVNVMDRLIGIAVDTVQEVLDILEEDIDDPPSFGTSLDTQFILGMGKVKEKVTILLDVARVLGQDDWEMLEEISDNATEESKEEE